MRPTMKIFAFAGSSKTTPSWNKKLLALAEAELTKGGAEIDHLEFTAATAPVFDDELVVTNRIPPAVLELKERIRKCDAVLIATPEYNYSLPGPLKNLLDWLSRPPKDNPFKGKVFASLGATIGLSGTLWAQKELRHVMGTALQTRPMPGMPFTLQKAPDAIDEQGQLKDEAQRKVLADFCARLLAEPVAR